MPNPKKHHVRYARRIPAAFVEKMDACLDGLMANEHRSPAVTKALAMVEESSKRMSTYSDEKRKDLEKEAREIIKAPLFRPNGKL